MTSKGMRKEPVYWMDEHRTAVTAVVHATAHATWPFLNDRPPARYFAVRDALEEETHDD